MLVDLLQRLDAWLLIIAIGFAVMLEYDRIKRWWGKRQAGKPVKHSTPSGGIVMSRPLISPSPSSRVDNRVDVSVDGGAITNQRQLSLPVNGLATDEDEGDRDITDDQNALRYDERLRTLADLINGGATKQAEGIEAAFHIKRSGRKDSKYAQIRADLLPLLKNKEGDPAVSPIAQRPYNPANFHSDNPELRYEEPAV